MSGLELAHGLWLPKFDHMDIKYMNSEYSIAIFSMKNHRNLKTIKKQPYWWCLSGASLTFLDDTSQPTSWSLFLWLLKFFHLLSCYNPWTLSHEFERGQQGGMWEELEGGKGRRKQHNYVLISENFKKCKEVLCKLQIASFSVSLYKHAMSSTEMLVLSKVPIFISNCLWLYTFSTCVASYNPTPHRDIWLYHHHRALISVLYKALSTSSTPFLDL